MKKRMMKVTNVLIIIIGVISSIFQILQGHLRFGCIIIGAIVIPGVLAFTFHYWGPFVLPPYAPIRRLFKLHIEFIRCDQRFGRIIRRNIADSRMTYLQPLPESCKQWGTLFSYWYQRIKNTCTKNSTRWSLFSDLYLNQEKTDFQTNKFATQLDLYAKSILLNFYLTIDPLNLFVPSCNSPAPSRIIWIFTKMLPTDWPLCPNTCNKTLRCLSGDKLREKEEKFLKDYLSSFRASASLAPQEGDQTFFCRYILVSEEPHSKFKDVNQLEAALKSHHNEYFQKLHTDINNNNFGKSYKIVFDKGIAGSWPEILNDAVLYGYRYPGSSNIRWEWAICTTYSPKYPTILLYIFELSDKRQIERLNSELQNLYLCLNCQSLDDFTNWVEDKKRSLMDDEKFASTILGSY